MQPFGLNNLPKEILYSIVQKLDFNSCRDLRFTCSEIYWDDEINQLYNECAKNAFAASKLYKPPTSSQLIRHFSAQIAVITGFTVVGSGGAGVVCLTLASAKFFISGLVLTVASAITGTGVLAMRYICPNSFKLRPLLSIGEMHANVKPNDTDVEKLLGNNSRYGATERRQYDLEVEGDSELMPSSGNMEI